jgi:ABC-2 type transport system permease protein
VGVFASSLTENQIIAAVISFVSLLIMFAAGELAIAYGGLTAKILNWVSLLSRYDNFNRGIFQLSAVVYYLSFIFVFLFATIRIIEKRRWS